MLRIETKNLLLCLLLFNAHNAVASMEFSDRDFKNVRDGAYRAKQQLAQEKEDKAKEEADKNRVKSKEELVEEVYEKEADRITKALNDDNYEHLTNLYRPDLYNTSFTINKTYMVELLKKGDNLDCDSLMTLGKAYYWAKDRDKAIHYFELAAKDVNTAPMALYNLGFVYSNQGNIKGFKRDMGKAIEYYSNSTNLGDSHAQRDLGLIYMDDSTNELHKSAGLDYLIKAAIKGDFLAKMQLAEKLAHGKGVPQNYVLAYAIVERWASRDNKNIDLRSYIYNKMTSYEYSEAISLSKNEKEIFSLLQ